MSIDQPSAIEILFTGDLCPQYRIEEACRTGHSDDIYDGSLREVLREKDLSVTNLECPLTDYYHPIIKSGPTLRSSKKSIAALTSGYFDIAALANNHIMDQGEQGLADTQQLCEQAGITTMGAGNNLAEASQVLYQDVRGQTIAFINATEHEFCIAKEDRPGANPLNPVHNYYQVLEAKEKADYVIVVVHGGNEHYPLPNPGMVDTYRYLADLGVSAVVGHHSHFAGGYEVYRGVPIFYSLGNFLFDKKVKKLPYWYKGYLVKLRLTKEKVNFEVHPYTQCLDKAKVQLIEGKQKQSYLNTIADYCAIIQDRDLLLEHWNNFLSEKRNMYYAQLFGLNRLERFLLKQNISKDFIVRRSKVPVKINLLRCQAHRRAVANLLEGDYKII